MFAQYGDFSLVHFADPHGRNHDITLTVESHIASVGHIGHAAGRPGDPDLPAFAAILQLLHTSEPVKVVGNRSACCNPDTADFVRADPGDRNSQVLARFEVTDNRTPGQFHDPLRDFGHHLLIVVFQARDRDGRNTEHRRRACGPDRARAEPTPDAHIRPAIDAGDDQIRRSIPERAQQAEYDAIGGITRHGIGRQAFVLEHALYGDGLLVLAQRDLVGGTAAILVRGHQPGVTVPGKGPGECPDLAVVDAVIVRDQYPLGPAFALLPRVRRSLRGGGKAEHRPRKRHNQYMSNAHTRVPIRIWLPP